MLKASEDFTFSSSVFALIQMNKCDAKIPLCSPGTYIFKRSEYAGEKY